MPTNSIASSRFELPEVSNLLLSQQLSATVRIHMPTNYILRTADKTTQAWAIAVFGLAGLCEIGGGWLVWHAIREKRPRWWIIPGVLLLAAYGFVAPALLPDVASAEFGRAFAVYGGVFIAMSLSWGVLFDGFKPDAGDYAGASVALVGVAIMWWFPR